MLRYLLVLPAVIVVFATAICPLVESLRLSFTVGRLNRPGSLDQYLGWENFTWAIFEEPSFWNSVWVTGVYTVVTVGPTTVLALGLALLLAPGGRLRSGVQTLLILPFAMSPALIGVSFRFMFNPEFGLFDAFFGVVFPSLADVSWLADPTLAFAVCVMADVWGWIPFLTLVLIGGLASVPKEKVEAAQVDGASVWRVFRDVTLPQLAPALALVVILKSIFSLKTFDQIFMLTNGGPGTATQFMSAVVIILPFFAMFRDIGLLDTRLGLILVNLAVVMPFAIWMIKGFIDGIPLDTEEAAMVDGSSRLQVIRNIVLPMAVPGLLTAGIFCFILAWNEFLFALILTNKDAVTLPIGLALFKAEEGDLWNLLSAAGIIIMLPMFVLALLIRKYFVQGMTIWAVR